jgi:hypothetical protein
MVSIAGIHRRFAAGVAGGEGLSGRHEIGVLTQP